MSLISSMTRERYNELSPTGKIGIRVPSDSLEAPEEVCLMKYAEFDIKRLTKTTSFLAGDETMYIVKKDYKGKASVLFHVYRVSDKRYVCPSALSKEDTIKMVQRKYVDFMDS